MPLAATAGTLRVCRHRSTKHTMLDAVCWEAAASCPLRLASTPVEIDTGFRHAGPAETESVDTHVPHRQRSSHIATHYARITVPVVLLIMNSAEWPVSGNNNDEGPPACRGCGISAPWGALDGVQFTDHLEASHKGRGIPAFHGRCADRGSHDFRRNTRVTVGEACVACGT